MSLLVIGTLAYDTVETVHAFRERALGGSAVYFSYGLCEPRGPQAVVGLDSLKAHGLLVRLAQLIAGRSPGYPIATRQFQDRVPS